MDDFRSLACLAALLLACPALAAADEPKAEKVPVLLDTDIGTDIDDAFALALAVASPEVDLRGVTTVSGDTTARARMCCRLLTAAGRKDVPVAAGPKDKPPQALRGMQAQYAAHPAVVFRRTSQPVKEGAVEFLYNQLKADQGKITIVAVGPLSNVAQLLTDHPDCKPWIKRIVLMGGSVRVGYNGKPPPEPEFNIYTDPKAAQVVFTSGVPLTVAPLDATTMLQLDDKMLARIFGTGSLLTMQLQALYQLWDQKEAPTMYDPVAVTLAFTDRFCKMEDLCLEVDDRGNTREVKGKPNCRVATSINKDEYLRWLVDRFAAMPKAPAPRKPGNPSKLVERTGFPNRVHAFEDFETDIERHWWMSGKGETANVPPGSTRACRGVLTQDFDDLQGDLATMYTAVIFNPVPGPPMGKQPRLGFRYWLKGTDTLRVQIYSLTKGYHRCLTLTGLPQETWQSGTVDMTAARRPDGSGGPLSEEERIDDIQFYAESTADLLIDDIVLYDAAPPDEKRPFPRSVLYTGLFDTGKQGKEWPGTFDIALKQGHFWHAARAVENPNLNAPWIDLNLRGPRPAGAKTRLFFRYRLEGADAMTVLLVNRTRPELQAVELTGLKKGAWATATVDFTPDAERGPRKGDRIDGLQFRLPKGAELLIDDVLLYEPGEAGWK